MKSLKIVSRVIELTKRPKNKNLPNRNVSISYEEKGEIQDNDTVVLKVYNQDHELVAERTYSAKEFRKGLVEREKKLKGGWRKRYFTLEY